MALGVTHVATESTGVFWRPVYNVLKDDRRTLLLVNPQHMRAVPGKKTSMQDTEWIAHLLSMGLVASQFYSGRLRARTVGVNSISQDTGAGAPTM
jgi:hypothetical protein